MSFKLILPLSLAVLPRNAFCALQVAQSVREFLGVIWTLRFRHRIHRLKDESWCVIGSVIESVIERVIGIMSGSGIGASSVGAKTY